MSALRTIGLFTLGVAAGATIGNIITHGAVFEAIGEKVSNFTQKASNGAAAVADTVADVVTDVADVVDPTA